MEDSHTDQSSNERLHEISTSDIESLEHSTLPLHPEETDDSKRFWSTSAASDVAVEKESNNQTDLRITTDTPSTSLHPSSVALSEADYSLDSQPVSSSESHRDDVFIASTVEHDSVSVSEMTSPSVTSENDNLDDTSAYGDVIEDSTAGTINSQPSSSAVTEKLYAYVTFNMTSLLETRSEEKLAVTSESHAFSTDSTIVEDGEPTTTQLGSESHTQFTGTLDSAEVNTTASELIPETSDAFTEVENLSRGRSDSLYLNESISENDVWTQNGTTPISLSSRAEERTAISESHLPSEILYTDSRTVEDIAGTPSTTTDSARAPLSTSEAAKWTQRVNGTEPVRRTQFYSQTVDQLSTVSEVASEAPLESGSSSENGQVIGVVVGVTFGVVALIVVVIIVAMVIYRRKRKMTGYITDYDLKDYRSLMKPTTVTSPSVVQPISPFSDGFPQDVASNGPSASKYKAINFDRTSDDGLDGIEIIHDDSREQRSPKEIPVNEEFDQNPSGYSAGPYSVNTFLPPERKNEPRATTNFTQSEPETKINDSESSGSDEKAIEK